MRNQGDPNTEPLTRWGDETEALEEETLDKGVIIKSNSPWPAPAILVPKKSTDGKQKFIFL